MAILLDATVDADLGDPVTSRSAGRIPAAGIDDAAAPQKKGWHEFENG
ncbi:MAG TPA: hypothetical protein VKE96_21100 [Vicinamibacterales bacterium]|nr:hypothetical protein [Vicinamibacterales bacterium]